MCGIVGWIDWNRDLTREGPVLDSMTGTLAARGPDASGTWISRHAALGHRRLIVVDPVGGAQPMTRERDGRSYTIVYNGELYNTPELRCKLEARGHVFLTRNSDTEALLMSFIEWGPACVERLNGIFAFGVWDETEQTLFLARDRLGVKPLFYTVREETFIFASEPKAILVHPEIRAEVDAAGLAELFFIGPARTPGQGVFKDIAELKPAHSLIFNRSGLHIYEYWSLESRPHTDDLETTAATIRKLLEDTVQRQLVSDVPVCTFLSGGLDSSAITAFAAAAYRREGMGPLHTFSVDYAGNDRHFRPNRFQPDSDAPWVRRVSEAAGTVHHYVTVDTPELLETLKTTVLANDLPGMADIDSSLLLFCREVKKEATVGVSGESADEVFGGYPWFYSKEALEGDTFPWIRMTREKAALLAPEVVKAIRPEEYIAARYREAVAEVPRLKGEDPFEARMREMSYLNIRRFMPTLLDRKDRMSMAVGFEVRVPFCDHRLVQYVWNIPWRMKSHCNREKGILRLALKGVLPDDVLERRKSPYPKTHNPAYLAATRGWLLSILDDPASPLLPLLNVPAVRRVAESGGGSFNPAWFGQLMGAAQLFAYLAQVDLWLRHYKVGIRL
ncbi:asparagine synthase (glutamine-hydrolyzing) [Desulforudis sp. 1088]|uniref:asparagine synthase (glutamine-hydrolyzing) n=1 Tax=unclassified Candidatus Desulforudis TaxID=2635950 RepID=UPI003CE55472